MSTNTLSTIGTSSPVEATGDDLDQYFNALEGDIVPRSSGVPTAGGGASGTTTYPWSEVNNQGNYNGGLDYYNFHIQYPYAVSAGSLAATSQRQIIARSGSIEEIVAFWGAVNSVNANGLKNVGIATAGQSYTLNDTITVGGGSDGVVQVTSLAANNGIGGTSVVSVGTGYTLSSSYGVTGTTGEGGAVSINSLYSNAVSVITSTTIKVKDNNTNISSLYTFDNLLTTISSPSVINSFSAGASVTEGEYLAISVNDLDDLVSNNSDLMVQVKIRASLS